MDLDEYRWLAGSNPGAGGQDADLRHGNKRRHEGEHTGDYGDDARKLLARPARHGRDRDGEVASVKLRLRLLDRRHRKLS